MFRISVNFDGPKYEYRVESYEKALGLFKRLNKIAEKLYSNDVIGDFYIELIWE